MKYKGYEISKQFLPGSDFTVILNGTIRHRKPTLDNVDYYYAEHIETGFKPANCATLAEMKDHITDLEKIDATI